jgi:hypothetical protein
VLLVWSLQRIRSAFLDILHIPKVYMPAVSFSLRGKSERDDRRISLKTAVEEESFQGHAQSSSRPVSSDRCRDERHRSESLHSQQITIPLTQAQTCSTLHRLGVHTKHRTRIGVSQLCLKCLDTLTCRVCPRRVGVTKIVPTHDRNSGPTAGLLLIVTFFAAIRKLFGEILSYKDCVFSRWVQSVYAQANAIEVRRLAGANPEETDVSLVGLLDLLISPVRREQI